MKRYALGFAVLALSSGPVFAADAGVVYAAAPPPIDSPVYAPTPLITADVALFVGYQASSPAEGFGGIRGRVNFPLWWGLQEELEAVGALGFDDGSALGVFSHTYHKNQQMFYGVLLGATGQGNGESTHDFTAGVEGGFFFPQATVAGLVSYTWPENGPEWWTIGLEGRWYFTPNDKLFGIVRHFTEGPNWLLAAGYEHWFDGTSISAGITAGWKGGNSHDSHFAMVDVTHHFGSSSLQGADWDRPFHESRLVLVSDIRLKHDIVPIGRLQNGLGLYRYAYNGSDQVYVGVMAQEVASVMPEAVVQGADGYLRVDYGKLGLRLWTWEEWSVLTGEKLS
jgi:hypothetical protein